MDGKVGQERNGKVRCELYPGDAFLALPADAFIALAVASLLGLSLGCITKSALSAQRCWSNPHLLSSTVALF